MNYDFSQLNDKEFEILVVDLLSAAFKRRIERFKPGKDQGIDGRFFIDNKEICVQCKHYLRSGYKSLINKLKNTEYYKVVNFQPQRYIFATSLPLSRANKEAIKKIFNPFIKESDDIYGQEDLNDLLKLYPNVEESHFKLWISSTTVFNRVLNNAIKGRSEFEIEEINKYSYKYVATHNHDKALEHLKNNNVLIITGEPGIGKTTLAENICLFFVSKNYEFIVIEESLSEAEMLYSKGKKQIYYFDDFLGSNYFEAIENKKDSHIVKFIDRINKDKLKKFVLTSRTNIFNSGITHSDIFFVNKIDRNEYMLSIEKLSEFDRAKILYNHIWFSSLDDLFVDEFYKDKRYKDVIRHKNFNPRLIEFITDSDRIDINNSAEYWHFIVSTLENPHDIWSNCFKTQTNAYVRNIVKLTVFNGGSIEENQLKGSFYNLNNIENIKNPSHTEKDFKSASKLAIKSFLNRNFLNNKIFYTMFNPSIADYILTEYGDDTDSMSNIFKALKTTKSLDQLLNIEKEMKIPTDDMDKLKNAILEHAFDQNKDINYLIYISYIIDEKLELTKIFLSKIILSPEVIEEFSKLLYLLKKYHSDLEFENYDFLLFLFDGKSLELDEINDLIDFLEVFKINNKEIYNEVKNNITDFVIEEVRSLNDEIDISKYITFYDNYEYGFEWDCDLDRITSELHSLINDILDDSFPAHIFEKLTLNYNEITEAVDIDKIVDDYVSSLQDPDEDGYHRNYNDFSNNIDDLFERT